MTNNVVTGNVPFALPPTIPRLEKKKQHFVTRKANGDAVFVRIAISARS